jgi:hypothetical protein
MYSTRIDLDRPVAPSEPVRSLFDRFPDVPIRAISAVEKDQGRTIHAEHIRTPHRHCRERGSAVQERMRNG